MTDKITTIQVKPTTRDRLKKLGSIGETYDIVINRLIDSQSCEQKPVATI